MVRTEIKRAVIAVVVAWSGSVPPERLCRFYRCRVIFPDIGSRFIAELGFLRYPGELSFVVPEATEHELSLMPGLTIHL
jgi:hypothetical protein